MSDPFELIANRNNEGLSALLASEPEAARQRHVSGASTIAWAAYVGNAEALALLRSMPHELDAHEAIIVGDGQRLEAALAGGWDANELSADGFAPLALAAFFDNEAGFALLLPLTKDVSQQSENPQKVAALHAATAKRNAGMVDRLLLAGAKADQAQADGFTPLHVAAQNGDGRIAALLVLAGADPTNKDDRGLDAAAHAREGGHEALAVTLECVRR